MASESDSNLTEQDEINGPWQPPGLLTLFVFPHGSRTRSLPAAARLCSSGYEPVSSGWQSEQVGSSRGHELLLHGRATEGRLGI